MRVGMKRVVNQNKGIVFAIHEDFALLQLEAQVFTDLLEGGSDVSNRFVLLRKIGDYRGEQNKSRGFF